jgi:hypothetical protein
MTDIQAAAFPGCDAVPSQMGSIASLLRFVPAFGPR